MTNHISVDSKFKVNWAIILDNGVKLCKNKQWDGRLGLWRPITILQHYVSTNEIDEWVFNIQNTVRFREILSAILNNVI